MQGITRRGFLTGAAGLAVAGVLPASAGKRATVTPLAGVSVKPDSYQLTDALAAAKRANRYIGLPLATTLQKIFIYPGTYESNPSTMMSQLAPSGCQFLLAVNPSRELSAAEQARLAAWLEKLKLAGLPYRVVIAQECDNKGGGFPTEKEWLKYWRYYAPIVQAAGVTCGYDPGCSRRALPRALSYFPSDPTPDELWMDFYCDAFQAGSRIDKLISLAGSVKIPAGIAEWGSGPEELDTAYKLRVWNDYGNYITDLAKSGHLKLGSIYYGSKHNAITTAVIASASDPRIPAIRNVAEAIAARR